MAWSGKSLATPAWLCGLWLCSLACSDHADASPPQGASATAVPTAAAVPPPVPLDAVSVMHVVKEGETLWDIARAYGVTVDAIQQANGRNDRSIRKLSKGTQLRIPGASKAVDVLAEKQRQAAQDKELPAISDGAYHRIQQGETLWTVARSYDIAPEKLMERNKLTDEDVARLRVGRAIVIPGLKASQIKQADHKPRGFTYTIAPGETVWDIAHRYAVGVGEIMSANRLSAEEANNVRDGQRIFLPGVEDDGRGRARRRAPVGERRALGVAQQLGLGDLRAAAALLHGRVEERWIRAANAVGSFSGRLVWPVKNGWFVRGYGSGQGGYHKAMDIAGKMGWNVRAAAPGIVGYSGDDVPGFGNMVMVVHPGGWVTLYAHNSVNFVVAGQRVDRRAILAEVGSTGRSQGPHVHFELIHGNKNCDPAPLFQTGVRKRNGKVMAIEPATWRLPHKRPKLVRCAKRQKHPVGKTVMQENPNLDVTPEAEQAPELDKAPIEEE